jgi:hypothetical protein
VLRLVDPGTGALTVLPCGHMMVAGSIKLLCIYYAAEGVEGGWGGAERYKAGTRRMSLKELSPSSVPFREHTLSRASPFRVTWLNFRLRLSFPALHCPRC